MVAFPLNDYAISSSPSLRGLVTPNTIDELESGTQNLSCARVFGML